MATPERESAQVNLTMTVWLNQPPALGVMAVVPSAAKVAALMVGSVVSISALTVRMVLLPALSDTVCVTVVGWVASADSAMAVRVKEASPARARPEPVSEAAKTWLDGAVHRKNLLSGDFREVGVGVAAAEDGTPYWGLILATRRDAPDDRRR